jgi:hypothetical protein
LNSKYVSLNQLHANDNNFYDTLNYGLKRQHSLTSINATTNTYSSFLDKKSMDAFLNSNLNYNSSNVNLEVNDNPTSTFNTKTPKHPTQFILTLLLLGGNLDKPETVNSYFRTITTNPSVWGLVNADSDKKSFNSPIRKFFNDLLVGKVVKSGNMSPESSMFVDSINNSVVNYNSNDSSIV